MSAITNIIKKNDVLCFYALNRKFHCNSLDAIMKSLTQVGSTFVAILVSILLTLYNKHMGFMLVLNLLASQFLIHLLKRIVNRPRPYKTLEWAVAINPPKCRYSLPSGHSGSALSIALILATFFPFIKIALVAVAILVGVSRVYLGEH
jgi:undecaprenyl-diphosphatase